MLREADGLSWLTYTSSSKQGGGATCKSYHNESPIRVFRSSKLKSPFAPPQGKSTSYRYDGLYKVITMWDASGVKTEDPPPVGEDQHTFLLTRLPKMASSDDIPGNNYNSIGIQELWELIQKNNCVMDPEKFSEKTLNICDLFDENASKQITSVPLLCPKTNGKSEELILDSITPQDKQIKKTECLPGKIETDGSAQAEDASQECLHGGKNMKHHKPTELLPSPQKNRNSSRSALGSKEKANPLQKILIQTIVKEEQHIQIDTSVANFDREKFDLPMQIPQVHSRSQMKAHRPGIQYSGGVNTATGSPSTRILNVAQADPVKDIPEKKKQGALGLDVGECNNESSRGSKLYSKYSKLIPSKPTIKKSSRQKNLQNKRIPQINLHQNSTDHDFSLLPHVTSSLSPIQITSATTSKTNFSKSKGGKGQKKERNVIKRDKKLLSKVRKKNFQGQNMDCKYEVVACKKPKIKKEQPITVKIKLEQKSIPNAEQSSKRVDDKAEESCCVKIEESPTLKKMTDRKADKYSSIQKCVAHVPALVPSAQFDNDKPEYEVDNIYSKETYQTKRKSKLAHGDSGMLYEDLVRLKKGHPLIVRFHDDYYKALFLSLSKNKNSARPVLIQYVGSKRNSSRRIRLADTFWESTKT